MKLLLLSNSTTDEGYLSFARAAIAAWATGRRRAVFIPFAGVTRDWDDYAQLVKTALSQLDLDITPIHREGDPVGALRQAELVMVGGGNTFHLLHHCRRLGLIEALRQAVRLGTPYLGWSAGSNLACPTICTTNDMPIIDPGGFDALDLLPFQINPHYTNALPEGMRGETRNQRIAEFARVNPRLPVLGLPEGNWLRVEGAQYELHGPQTSWWFEAGQEPRALQSGALDIL